MDLEPGGISRFVRSILAAEFFISCSETLEMFPYLNISQYGAACTTRQKETPVLCLSLTLNIYNFIVLPKIYSETTPNLLLLPIFWPCVCSAEGWRDPAQSGGFNRASNEPSRFAKTDVFGPCPGWLQKMAANAPLKQLPSN